MADYIIQAKTCQTWLSDWTELSSLCRLIHITVSSVMVSFTPYICFFFFFFFFKVAHSTEFRQEWGKNHSQFEFMANIQRIGKFCIKKSRWLCVKHFFRDEPKLWSSSQMIKICSLFNGAWIFQLSSAPNLLHSLSLRVSVSFHSTLWWSCW